MRIQRSHKTSCGRVLSSNGGMTSLKHPENASWAESHTWTMIDTVYFDIANPSFSFPSSTHVPSSRMMARLSSERLNSNLVCLPVRTPVTCIKGFIDSGIGAKPGPVVKERITHISPLTVYNIHYLSRKPHLHFSSQHLDLVLRPLILLAQQAEY